jgi:hypothetical protein
MARSLRLEVVSACRGEDYSQRVASVVDLKLAMVTDREVDLVSLLAVVVCRDEIRALDTAPQ